MKWEKLKAGYRDGICFAKWACSLPECAMLKYYSEQGSGSGKKFVKEMEHFETRVLGSGHMGGREVLRSKRYKQKSADRYKAQNYPAGQSPGQTLG